MNRREFFRTGAVATPSAVAAVTAALASEPAMAYDRLESTQPEASYQVLPEPLAVPTFMMGKCRENTYVFDAKTKWAWFNELDGVSGPHVLPVEIHHLLKGGVESRDILCRLYGTREEAIADLHEAFVRAAVNRNCAVRVCRE